MPTCVITYVNDRGVAFQDAFSGPDARQRAEKRFNERVNDDTLLFVGVFDLSEDSAPINWYSRSA